MGPQVYVHSRDRRIYGRRLESDMSAAPRVSFDENRVCAVYAQGGCRINARPRILKFA